MKDFFLNNWPYLFLVCIGILLLANGSNLEVGISSRIMNSGGGAPVNIGAQRILGVLVLAYAAYKIFRNNKT